MANGQLKWSDDDLSTLEISAEGDFMPGTVVSGMKNLELPRDHEEFKFFSEFGQALIEEKNILTPYEALAIRLGLAPREWTEFVPWAAHLSPNSHGSMWSLIQKRITAPGAMARFRRSGRVFDMDLSTASNRTSDVESIGDLPEFYNDFYRRLAGILQKQAESDIDTIFRRIYAAMDKYSPSRDSVYGRVLAGGHKGLETKYLTYNQKSSTELLSFNNVYSTKENGRPNPVMDTLHMCNSVQIVSPTSPARWRNPIVYREIDGANNPDLPQYFPHTPNVNTVVGPRSKATCDTIRRIRLLLSKDDSAYRYFRTAEGIRGIFDISNAREKLALMRVWYPWVNGPMQFGDTRAVTRGLQLVRGGPSTQQDFAYTLLLLHAANFSSETYLNYTASPSDPERVTKLTFRNLEPYTASYLTWVKFKCARAIEAVQSWWGETPMPLNRTSEYVKIPLEGGTSSTPAGRLFTRADILRDLSSLRAIPEMVDSGVDFSLPGADVLDLPGRVYTDLLEDDLDEIGGDMDEIGEDVIDLPGRESTDLLEDDLDEIGGDMDEIGEDMDETLLPEVLKQDTTAAEGVGADSKWIYIGAAVVIAGAIGTAVVINKKRSAQSEI